MSSRRKRSSVFILNTTLAYGALGQGESYTSLVPAFVLSLLFSAASPLSRQPVSCLGSQCLISVGSVLHRQPVSCLGSQSLCPSSQSLVSAASLVSQQPVPCLSSQSLIFTAASPLISAASLFVSAVQG